MFLVKIILMKSKGSHGFDQNIDFTFKLLECKMKSTVDLVCTAGIKDSFATCIIKLPTI
jgi:hypothetical protein